MKTIDFYDSLIFTHIPKCGGTSFRHYIYQAAISSGLNSFNIFIPGINNIPNDYNIENLNKKQIEILKYFPIKIWAGHQKHKIVEKNISTSFKNPFYFTILREPIERFISHYNFFNYKLGYNGCKGIGLNDLSISHVHTLASRLSNLQVNYLANIPNKKAISSDNLMRIAKYNILCEYDSFGLLEYTEESITLLKQRAPHWLSFNHDFPLYNDNKTTTAIDPKVLEIIRKNNLLDYELYSFAKEEFLSRYDDLLKSSNQLLSI